MSPKNQCPVMHGSLTRHHSDMTSNRDWWPDQLDVSVLNQHPVVDGPMPDGFQYKKAFLSLDYAALKTDLHALMTDSQAWWPADYGHYGPLFIRMAWHSAGTYRISDGRGGGREGAQRFAPLNSWPDNGNLDKARRLLWPIKQKYGKQISWADLMLLAGNVAIESMGGKTIGFSGGREDTWASQPHINWGIEKTWLDNQRYQGDRDLDYPLAAVQMGLIYVNPQGPDGVPDPLGSARDIRETFYRMGVNDEETVALTAGGHTFGKTHGAGDPSLVGPEPEAAPLEAMGLGWLNAHGSGHGRDTTTSGLEGAWTPNPTQWDNAYFDLLLGYEWELTKSPAGAYIWHAIDLKPVDLAPDVEDPTIRVPIMMTTADMAMREDPAYRAISERFRDNPDEFSRVFANAWFKLTHRDMGPITRYVGPEVPSQSFVWQDPIDMPVDHGDIESARVQISAAGLSIQQRIETAWASASTFRCTDMRGGANGARIRLAPQKDWAVNQPIAASNIMACYETIAAATKVSVADVIVLAGNMALEEATGEAVSLTPGRGDATQAQTDETSFAVLEPIADGFRNYVSPQCSIREEDVLLDRALLLGLSASEMTVLLGGLRSLGVGLDHAHGFVAVTGELSNKFLVKLLDMQYQWRSLDDHQYEAIDRDTGESCGRVSRVDMIVGSHSQLRAIAEVYASEDASLHFKQDFIAVWQKVMNADRFDV